MRTVNIMIAAVILLLSTLAVAGAAAPDVAAGTATVDGAIGEWTTSPGNVTNEDWFAASHLAGKDGKPEVGDIFVRYDCQTESMFVLALHRTAGEVHTDQNPDEIRVEIDSSTMVDSDDGSFAWVNQSGSRADGWEASFTLAKPPQDGVAEGRTIRVHYLFDNGEAGQTADFAGATLDLSLICSSGGPTAVTIAGPVTGNSAALASGPLAAAAAVIGLMLATALVWNKVKMSGS